ncbi:subtilisin-like serine protease QhpE [Ruegeria sp. MALMAid1280]|uniref:subtilisin-like serine protease QhpE n=1 Tax=Ruegeria sp. MALMAid1280 TaxID=3411634 RepID=UPI003B9F0AF5
MTGSSTIALIDGPLPTDFAALGRREICCDIESCEADSTALRHATQMAHAILRNTPGAQIDNYVVFPGTLSTSVSSICNALDLVAQSDAMIVHCSFGLARDVPRLERSIRSITAAGKTIVASAPARGGPVYPAFYRDVIAVQGDARCGPQEWSRLNLPHADFGACPSGADPHIGGASIAAAHFSGLYAHQIQLGRDHGMEQLATYKGRERIQSVEGPRA